MRHRGKRPSGEPGTGASPSAAERVSALRHLECRLKGRKQPSALANNFWHLVITIRTQVSLTKPEYAAAKREAARLGISLAELLRRSLRTMIPVDDSKPWMRYAGMVESGDALSSQNIDDVLENDF